MCVLFPSDWACLIRMIMRGFPIFAIQLGNLEYKISKGQTDKHNLTNGYKSYFLVAGCGLRFISVNRYR